MEQVRGGIHVRFDPGALSSVGKFESKCRASSLRSTTPVCEIMSRDHTFLTASTALVPCRQMSRLPDGMSCQTHGVRQPHISLLEPRED